MKKTLALLSLLFSPLLSSAAPPSDASIAALLDAMKSESVLEQAYSNLEQMVRQQMEQAREGRRLTEEQKQVLDLAPRKLAAVIRAELSWHRMKPIYMSIYRDTFDQEDVDGLIAFYRSPIGQRYVSRMPAVVQKTMSVTQEEIRAVVPKLQAAMREVLTEAKLTKPL